jgi:hypothetical protein
MVKNIKLALFFYSYVFVEDLQEMLLPYTPDEPIFFGFRMNPVLPQGYMSDNAG